MSRITGPVITATTDYGWIRSTMMQLERVGDRMVPAMIEVDFPGGDGEPALEMLIEVIDGVPRCTELTFRRTEGGREIRPKDLRRMELESLIESVVAMCSGQIEPQEAEGVARATFSGGDDDRLAGMKVIRDARKGSRRPLTDERKRRVADVYNAHETGGIEAVQAAFVVSRSTAVRYIKGARDTGLIETGKS